METATSSEHRFDDSAPEQLLVVGLLIQLSENDYLAWLPQHCIPLPPKLAVIIISLPEADTPGRGKKQYSVLLPALFQF